MTCIIYAFINSNYCIINLYNVNGLMRCCEINIKYSLFMLMQVFGYFSYQFRITYISVYLGVRQIYHCPVV